MQTLMRSWNRKDLEAHWWRTTYEATWKARMWFCSSTTRCFNWTTCKVLQCYTQNSPPRADDLIICRLNIEANVPTCKSIGVGHQPAELASRRPVSERLELTQLLRLGVVAWDQSSETTRSSNPYNCSWEVMRGSQPAACPPRPSSFQSRPHPRNHASHVLTSPRGNTTGRMQLEAQYPPLTPVGKIPIPHPQEYFRKRDACPLTYTTLPFANFDSRLDHAIGDDASSCHAETAGRRKPSTA